MLLHMLTALPSKDSKDIKFIRAIITDNIVPCPCPSATAVTPGITPSVTVEMHVFSS